MALLHCIFALHSGFALLHCVIASRCCIALSTSSSATTPRQHRDGRHLRSEMMRKLLVLAPRHPAETTNRNGAKIT